MLESFAVGASIARIRVHGRSSPIARAPVSAGTHAIVVERAGGRREYSVEIPAGGFAVVVVTAPR